MGPILLNDVMFKIVFGTEPNTVILQPFLNVILGYHELDRIAQLTILNPNLDKENITSKGLILDVRAVDGRGRQFNVEVQLAEQSAYRARTLLYASRLFGQQIEIGQRYSKLAKTICISIVNFEMFPEEPGLHTIFRMREITSGLELTDLLEMHYIELPKLKCRPGDRLDTPLDRWLFTLLFGDLFENASELPQELREEEGISMAIEAMNRARSDAEVRQMLEDRWRAKIEYNSGMLDAHEKGLEQGLEQGREQGIEQGRMVLRRSIRSVLAHRFGEPPDDIEKLLQQIEDVARLEAMMFLATTASSAEEFLQAVK